jgi:hypothetical protein
MDVYRYSSIHLGHATEEIKGMVTEKRTEIEGAINATDNRVNSLENQLVGLNLGATNRNPVNETASESNPTRQLEDERQALNVSRKLLEDLLSKSQDEAIAKAVTEIQSRTTARTFGNQNSGFQAGIINGPVSGINFGGR